jgi:hypothetical protein
MDDLSLHMGRYIQPAFNFAIQKGDSPMEALLIRGFVLALALTGFGASTVSGSGGKSSSVTANDGISTLPTCPLNDPNNCGLD